MHLARDTRRIRSLLHVLGNMLFFTAPIYFIPILVALAYGEYHLIYAFLAPLILLLGTGHSLRTGFMLKSAPDDADAMVLCSIGWMLIPLAGTIPFLFILDISFINALFESVSGFTATGTTTLTGLATLPKALLFWRAFTQFLGGLGILALFIMISLGGTGGEHALIGAESHKAEVERISPGVANSTSTLWQIYLGTSAAFVLLYKAAGMNIFDAVIHAMTTISTGGFSNYDSSLAYFAQSNYPHYWAIELIAVGGMFLGGVNFLLIYHAWRGRWQRVWADDELRLYIYFSALMIAGVFLSSGRNHPEIQGSAKLLWDSIFQGVAIITSTGYATRNLFDPVFSVVATQIFGIMMFVGASRGSTSGGFKVYRVAILNKLVQREVFKIHASRRTVYPLVLNKKVVDAEEAQRITVLFFLWLSSTFVISTIIAAGSELDAWQAFSVALSSVSNIGPSMVSVTDTFALTVGPKLALIWGMILGRLEILPLLLVFSRRSWI